MVFGTSSLPPLIWILEHDGYWLGCLYFNCYCVQSILVSNALLDQLINVYASQRKQGGSKAAQRFQRFQESDYMDPKQGLCLGALFDIAATNVSRVPFAVLLPASVYLLLMLKLFIQGLDMGRRLCIFGFCRSIEMLSDVVEDTVLEHGGEVCHIYISPWVCLHTVYTSQFYLPFDRCRCCAVLVWTCGPINNCRPKIIPKRFRRYFGIVTIVGLRLYQRDSAIFEFFMFLWYFLVFILAKHIFIQR
jgi:hypothetical protein